MVAYDPAWLHVLQLWEGAIGHSFLIFQSKTCDLIDDCSVKHYHSGFYRIFVANLLCCRSRVSYICEYAWLRCSVRNVRKTNTIVTITYFTTLLWTESLVIYSVSTCVHCPLLFSLNPLSLTNCVTSATMLRRGVPVLNHRLIKKYLKYSIGHAESLDIPKSDMPDTIVLRITRLKLINLDEH